MYASEKLEKAKQALGMAEQVYNDRKTCSACMSEKHGYCVMHYNYEYTAIQMRREVLKG